MRQRTALALRPVTKTRIAFFWATVIAIPMSSALVIAILSRTLPHGGLAKVSIVFSLSLIGTVLPIGAQAKAAADAAANGSAGHVGWRPIWICTAVGVALSIPAAVILRVPALAVLCPVASLVPAIAVGVGRGELIGQGNFSEVSFNNTIEVTLRLVAGIGLGLAFKANGVAVSTLVYTLGAWMMLPHRNPVSSRIRLQGALLASTLLVLSVQVDLLLAPRLLGAGADRYATASLPSKGVYLALAAAAWLVVGGALVQRRFRDAVRPVVLVTLAGVALCVPMVIAAPLIGKLLGRPVPNRGLFFVLGLAMAFSAGNWILLQLRLARHAATLWVPPALAILFVVVIGAMHPVSAGLAAGMLIGQVVALVVGLFGLAYDIRTTDVPTEVPVPLIAGFGELTAESVFVRAAHTAPPPTRPAPPSDVVEPDPEADTSSEDEGRSRTSGWLIALSSALIAVQVFLQYPGLIVHDTRMDINLDPVTFMQRTWNLWEPFADMGRIQNQAVGYLFPMGPYFALGHFLHVPVWIIERSWIALILGIALWGAARLADELDIGTPLTRVVGAIAFALTPCILARAGTTSGFVLATAFLPWTIIPLIRGSRGGSVRRAAALSGLAVVCMGGINGAVTLAVLAMPAIYLMTRERGPRRASLMRWWALAVFFASAWWLIPLLFQGKYGVNFLIYTEQPATTTAFTPLIEVIRGTADWLSYFHLHGAYLPAGYALVFDVAPMIGTAIVAAVGLFGLARRSLNERRFLLLTFLTGVALVGAGYGGALGDPFAPEVIKALTNVLAGFRSVYKFEPLIALPLALGGMHGLAVASRWVSARAARTRTRSLPDWGRIAPAVVAVLVLTMAALPLFTNNLLSNGPFSQFPSWWTQADKYIAHVHGRVLLTPGESRGFQNWGFTEEDPLYVNNNTPWASRSIAPLGSRGANLYLDAVESTIEAGGNTALPAFLRRGGFSTVVVRNDDDWQTGDSIPPLTVNEAMQASGLKLVASFGPPLPQPTQAGIPKLDMHQIEIYSTGNAGDLASYPVANAALLSGGEESPMVLEQAGLPDEAYILASDYKAGDPLPAQWIITDGNRRRFLSFGLNRDYGSYVLTAGENGPNNASVSRGQYPEAKVENQTVAVRNGIKGVEASSSGSWLAPIPEVAPGLALDGDTNTAWASGPANGTSNGEWIQVELLKPISVDHVNIRLLEDGPWRPAVNSMRVTTSAGSVVTKVRSDQSTQALKMPKGPASWIRVSFESTTNLTQPSAGAGLRDLTIPGIDVVQMLKVPSEFVGQFSSDSSSLPIYAFQRSTVNPHSLVRHDEEQSIDRLFTVPKTGQWTVTATASPQRGPALLALLDSTPHFTIAASSTAGNLPEFAPRNLIDNENGSIWVSATAPASGALNGESLDASPSDAPGVIDRKPTITMTWDTTRTIDSIDVVKAQGYSSAAQLTITSGKDTRVVNIPANGKATFAPLTTKGVTIDFTRISRVVNVDSRGDQATRPVALAGLSFPQLADLIPTRTDDRTPVTASCADGPEMKVGGTEMRFSITSNLAEVTDLNSVTATPCTTTPLSLGRGQNTLSTSEGSSPFNLDTLTFVPSAHPAAATPTRTMTPVKWGDDSREVRVAAGAASYLVVNENFNIGWKATLDGKSLRAVTIDGWRQGFVVPAGAGGIVKLDYGPNTAYQLSLILGFLLVIALCFLALVRPTRFELRRPRAAAVARPALVGTLPRWLAPLAVMLAGLVVCGAGVLLAIPLWFVYRWRPRLPAAIAFVCFAGGGVFVALTQSPAPHRWLGAFSYPANLLATIALLAVAVTLLPRPPFPRRNESNRPPVPEEEHLPEPGRSFDQAYEPPSRPTVSPEPVGADALVSRRIDRGP